MKFLSVDDSSTMRKIVSLTLKGAGHTVDEAENGLQALEKLKSLSVDCILLDINMPEMNGIEFLKARKSIPAIAGIPVFVLTTQDEEALKKEALSLGAKGFIIKPFQKEALMSVINSGI
jgi:two-component system, chemotaxis family, chemotaxis protein CheY